MGEIMSQRTSRGFTVIELLVVMSILALIRMGMPCTSSPIPANWAATARSQHLGLVNVLKLDGSVHSISNHVDRNVWASLHSKDRWIP
jgi:prepilin-type N-terminal cleavage/methylation domain-containing protein